MSRCQPPLPRAELDARLDTSMGVTDVSWQVVVPPACRAALPRADRFRVKVGSVAGFRDTVDVAYLLERALLQPEGRRVAALRSGIIRMYAGPKDIGGARVPAWLQAVVDDRWALVDGDWRELDPAALAAALDEIRPLFGTRPDLPAWLPGDSPASYAGNAGNLHPGLLPLGGEFGDLLTETGDLVHVTTVADLGFTVRGALASARSLATSRETRARFAGQVESASLGRRKVGTRFRPSSMVFALLTATPVPPERIFPLVRLSLAEAARELGSLGVDVEISVHRP
ncbi:DUF6119 family protein [Herbidospora mongoliensis]|uniref:DUF6119 family protein n=1 Tax=Herbidospora mongoliensis TaxID=688067 RepID=UPI000834108B|nr:DUF6119 family protein [Herbidospora mongoliensis]